MEPKEPDEPISPSISSLATERVAREEAVGCGRGSQRRPRFSTWCHKQRALWCKSAQPCPLPTWESFHSGGIDTHFYDSIYTMLWHLWNDAIGDAALMGSGRWPRCAELLWQRCTLAPRRFVLRWRRWRRIRRGAEASDRAKQTGGGQPDAPGRGRAPMPQRLPDGTYVTARHWGMTKRQLERFCDWCREQRTPCWDDGDDVNAFVKKFVKPICQVTGMSVSLAINVQEPKPITVMVSHCWQENARDFFDDVLKDLSEHDVVYLCCLSNHQGTEEEIVQMLGSDAQKYPFTEVIQSGDCQRMLVVPCEELKENGQGLYSRMWCVWEVVVAVRKGMPITFAKRAEQAEEDHARGWGRYSPRGRSTWARQPEPDQAWRNPYLFSPDPDRRTVFWASCGRPLEGRKEAEETALGRSQTKRRFSMGNFSDASKVMNRDEVTIRKAIETGRLPCTRITTLAFSSAFVFYGYANLCVLLFAPLMEGVPPLSVFIVLITIGICNFFAAKRWGDALINRGKDHYKKLDEIVEYSVQRWYSLRRPKGRDVILLLLAGLLSDVLFLAGGSLAELVFGRTAMGDFLRVEPDAIYTELHYRGASQGVVWGVAADINVLSLVHGKHFKSPRGRRVAGTLLVVGHFLLTWGLLLFAQAAIGDGRCRYGPDSFEFYWSDQFPTETNFLGGFLGLCLVAAASRRWQNFCAVASILAYALCGELLSAFAWERGLIYDTEGTIQKAFLFTALATVTPPFLVPGWRSNRYLCAVSAILFLLPLIALAVYFMTGHHAPEPEWSAHDCGRA